MYAERTVVTINPSIHLSVCHTLVLYRNERTYRQTWGTGVRKLTRGLATLPQRWIQELLVVRDWDGRPPRGPSGSALLLCVCSGSVLLGDLLGVCRSKERDLLSVLLIYPGIFLHVFIVYPLLVGLLFVWLYSAICSCVLVVLFKLSVLAKWLAIERPIWWHIHEVRRLSHKAQVGERVCVYFSFIWFVYVAMCFPRPYTIYISYAYGTI